MNANEYSRFSANESSFFSIISITGGVSFSQHTLTSFILVFFLPSIEMFLFVYSLCIQRASKMGAESLLSVDFLFMCFRDGQRCMVQGYQGTISTWCQKYYMFLYMISVPIYDMFCILNLDGSIKCIVLAQSRNRKFMRDTPPRFQVLRFILLMLLEQRQ